jgi:hypothetical protein
LLGLGLLLGSDAGERMRDGSPDALEALSRQGRSQTVRDNLRVKEVRLERTPDRRWIVCHNPTAAERDQATRDAAIARLAAELDVIKTARARDAARAPKRGQKISDAAHRKAECALRDHPTLGSYLRQTPTGRPQINRAAIRAEERLDGTYLLSTSGPDLSAEDVTTAPGPLIYVKVDPKCSVDASAGGGRRVNFHVRLLCVWGGEGAWSGGCPCGRGGSRAVGGQPDRSRLNSIAHVDFQGTHDELSGLG